MNLVARLERLERRQIALEPPEFNWSSEYEARFEEIHRLAFARHPEFAEITDLDERARAIAGFCDAIYDDDQLPDSLQAIPAENPGSTGVGIGGCC